MKKGYSILATLLALCSWAPAWQTHSASHPRSDATAQRVTGDPLQEVEDLLQKHYYGPAEEKLRSLMATQARNPQAWFDLGFLQSNQNKSEEAIASYQKAVDLAPDWFEANLNLGMNLLNGSVSDANYVRAAQVLRHAVTLKPTSGGDKALSNAWLWLARALQWRDIKRGAEVYDKAGAEAYDKAAELNPSDPELLASAGDAWVQAGDLAGGEQRLKKAAEAGSVFALTKLIAVLAGQKQYAEATVWMSKYVSKNPQEIVSRAQLADLQIAAGKTEDAIATLEALRTTPAGPEIGRRLAALYLNAKQYDKAADILQELAQKSPQDAQLRWDLGTAFLHQHKYPEAEKEMFEALRINPEIDSKLEGDYWEMAYAAQQNKHYELAIRVLDARAQRLPETPTTYWIRAVSYDSLRAFKLAAANYRLFLSVDGGKSPEQEFQARHRLKAIEPQ